MGGRVLIRWARVDKIGGRADTARHNMADKSWQKDVAHNTACTSETTYTQQVEIAARRSRS